MNDQGSERYRQLDKANMNRPISELICPRCEAKGQAENDREISEPPGVFFCKTCSHSYCA